MNAKENLPSEWRTVTLGELNPYITSGSRGWAKNYSEFGQPFIRITNLSRESIYIDLSDLKRVTIPNDDSEGIRTQLRQGDLLISITADIGIIGYVDESISTPAYINQHIALARFDPEIVDTKYLAYYLASTTPQQRFHASTDQGAKAGMNLSGVRAIQAELPPIKEQRAIASALSDMDALLAKLDQLIAKKRDIKQAAMQELLMGRRRLTGFSGEWNNTPISRIARIISGATPSTDIPSFWNGGINWCTPTDITKQSGKYLTATERKISLLGLESCSAELLPPGALLLCTRATIGEIKIAAEQICTNQGFKSLVCHPEFHNQFIYYALQTKKAEMIERASGSTFLEISKHDLSAIRILTPQLAEQCAIATALSDMDTEITALEARREKTRLIKQGMMQELLSGRVRLI